MRIARLAVKMRNKDYRDSYVAAHTRNMLATQMRKFRGETPQAEFAMKIGKRQTMVSRLENPDYHGWTLRTLFEVASSLDVAVLIRFVDIPTFLTLSDDLSEKALRPRSYTDEATNEGDTK